MDLQPVQHTVFLALAWKRSKRVGQRSSFSTVAELARHSAGPHGPEGILGGDDELAWALRVSKKLNPFAGWSVFTNGRELCIVEGDFYAADPRRRADGEIVGIAGNIARQMRANPDQRITGLHGVWTGVYVDMDRDHAYAFGDLTGTRPLYWYSSEHDFIVASSLWAFRACGAVENQCDPKALNQWITTGTPLSGRTWIKSVRLRRRGHLVRASANGRTYETMQLQPAERKPWSHKHSVDRLRAALDETMASLAHHGTQRLGIGLSGGIDSRILLAAAQHQGVDLHALTFCSNYSERENAVARRCAELTQTRHESFVMDLRLAKSLVPDCLLLNAGESRGYALVLTGIEAARRKIDALLIGYPADLFAGHRPASFALASVRTPHELARRMLASTEGWLTPEEASLVFHPSLRVPWDDTVAEWDESFDIPHTSIWDLYTEKMMDLRLQRRTGPRIDQARPFCAPLYPYIDERVYSVYRQLPLRELVEERAHIGLLSSYGERLEDFPSTAKASLRIPVKHEYRARHVIHAARIIRARFLSPARRVANQFARRTIRAALPGAVKEIFARLAAHEMFDPAGIHVLAQRAADGSFQTAFVLEQMLCATMVHDYLFSGSFSHPAELSILQAEADLTWTRWSDRQPTFQASDGRHFRIDGPSSLREPTFTLKSPKKSRR